MELHITLLAAKCPPELASAIITQMDILQSQLAAERERSDRLQAVVDAAKSQVSQAEAYCVGRARFSRTGGNVGISWYVEDAMGETNGHRTGNPKDGDLLFVLAAQQNREKGQ